MWDPFLMPKKSPKKKIPKHGRSYSDVVKDVSMGGLEDYSADVPLGNTDPTVVQGVIWGGMPNASRMAKGRLRQFRGKRG